MSFAKYSNVSFETLYGDYQEDVISPNPFEADPTTIFGWLVAQPNFKQMVDLIVKARMVEYYNSKDTFLTLFATPDEYFSGYTWDTENPWYSRKRYLDYVTAPAALRNDDLSGKIQTRNPLASITATRTRLEIPVVKMPVSSKYRNYLREKHSAEESTEPETVYKLDTAVYLDDSVFVLNSVTRTNGYIHVLSGVLQPTL